MELGIIWNETGIYVKWGREERNQHNHITDTMFRYLIKVVFRLWFTPSFEINGTYIWTSLGFSQFYLSLRVINYGTYIGM